MIEDTDDQSEEQMDPKTYAAWTRFKQLMDRNATIKFKPSQRDLTFGDQGSVATNLGMYLSIVLLPMPAEFFKMLMDLGGIVLRSIAALAVGIVAPVIVPIIFVFRRLLLLVFAILGRLEVAPTAESLAEHINGRIRSVCDTLRKEGHSPDEFYREVEPSEITGDAKEHLLRMWSKD